ncbi:MAG: type II secretion system protein [Lachnospiraceae bacterium]|nr:type II secretion system protein [Lachnospiraceae bacterium]
MKKTNNKGFSLIELIIVIAIMAVLVAIIAPNLTKYLGSSKTSADTKNLDEIQSTLNTCITDYEMSNSTLIANGASTTVTAKWTSAGLTSTGITSLDAIINGAIDATKCQSKEDTSKWAQAVISKDSSTNAYVITMSWV